MAEAILRDAPVLVRALAADEPACRPGSVRGVFLTCGFSLKLALS
jgi:hypothetical protein